MSSHSSLPLLPNDVRWNATISATGFLISQDAYDLDQDLFSMGFTLEQLMELAGLSVAEAVNKCIPLHQPIHETKSSVHDDRIKMKRILVVCGPVSMYRLY
jgi:NAD(P)H-hydrate repair Nnr-like enzyme with NAD(P)H-hydrate epimerase domain